MILPTTNFKARLVEIPKIKKGEGSEEMIEYGKFTLNKKYRIYSVFSEKEFTDFLCADDSNNFLWINTAVFRK